MRFGNFAKAFDHNDIAQVAEQNLPKWLRHLQRMMHIPADLILQRYFGDAKTNTVNCTITP